MPIHWHPLHENPRRRSDNAHLMGVAMGEAVEWHVEAGREIATADSRGPINVGVRTSSWAAELLTDTLEVRWTPERQGGRAWLAARGEALFAHVLNGRWQQGAPAPETAVWASYAGLEGGALWYLPYGLYVGGQGVARGCVLGEKEGGLDLDEPLPDGVDLPTSPFWQVSPELVAGVWSERASAWVAAGAHVRQDRIIPSVRLEGRADVGERWGAEARLWAGAAEGADDVVRTRLGGLNPYVVPLAGAFWGEHWVEDYAAARLSPRWVQGPVRWALYADAAWFDGQGAVGLGTGVRLQAKRPFFEAAVGVSPQLTGSVWVRAGLDWGR
jgi:hypothetical protein